jgi:hypothetical protein
MIHDLSSPMYFAFAAACFTAVIYAPWTKIWSNWPITWPKIIFQIEPQRCNGVVIVDALFAISSWRRQSNNINQEPDFSFKIYIFVKRRNK